MRDRAVQNIVAAAALIPDGVLRHRTGLGRLAGCDLPKASVSVAGNHVCADIDIAVEWGRPLGPVAAAVSREVRGALSASSGLTVDRIVVHVAEVTGADHESSGRRVQ